MTNMNKNNKKESPNFTLSSSSYLLNNLNYFLKDFDEVYKILYSFYLLCAG